jgi:integrase
MSKRGNGEGSIYQDSRGFYRAAVTLDNGKRKYLSGKTRQAVGKKLNAALDANEKRLPMPGLRLLTAKYLSDWLEQTVKPSQKPLTYEKYAQVVKSHINPAIGSVPLARVTPAHVQKIQGAMAARGLSVSTINGMRTTLSAALSRAEKWGLVARNAVRLVDAPRTEDTEPRVLDPEEATAFLAATVHDEEMGYMFATALYTGLRPGEVRGLRWADVQLDGPAPAVEVRQQIVELKGRHRVVGEPKSKHGRRTIPLIPPALGALRAQKRRVAELHMHAGPQWQNRDLVFPNELGQPLVSRTVRDHFARVARQAGIVDATPHTLRHSTGTFLLAAGVSDRVVQSILGHGSAAMTRHYQHVLPAMLSDAGTRLAHFLEATS